VTIENLCFMYVMSVFMFYVFMFHYLYVSLSSYNIEIVALNIKCEILFESSNSDSEKELLLAMSVY